MAKSGVKKIHAHREVNGETDYVVEWMDENLKNNWEVVEEKNMTCENLLRDYTEKRVKIEYWESILEKAYMNYCEDLEAASKSERLPSIVDNICYEEDDSELEVHLPVVKTEVITKTAVHVPSSNGENQISNPARPPPLPVTVKRTFTKRVSYGVVNFLCECSDGRFRWIKIDEITDIRMLKNVYIIEQILSSELKQKLIKEADDDDDDDDDSSTRKRMKFSRKSAEPRALFPPSPSSTDSENSDVIE